MLRYFLDCLHDFCSHRLLHQVHVMLCHESRWVNLCLASYPNKKKIPPFVFAHPQKNWCLAEVCSLPKTVAHGEGVLSPLLSFPFSHVLSSLWFGLPPLGCRLLLPPVVFLGVWIMCATDVLHCMVMINGVHWWPLNFFSSWFYIDILRTNLSALGFLHVPHLIRTIWL